MQKNTLLLSALLLVSLWTTHISHAFTIQPEAMAATLQFCQEKFNINASSPQGSHDCVQQIKETISDNALEMRYIYGQLVTKITSEERTALEQKLYQLGDQETALTKVVDSFAPSKLNLTQDEVMRVYTQGLLKTLKNCTESSTRNTFFPCLMHGLLDEVKAFMNRPDVKNPDYNNGIYAVIDGVEKELAALIDLAEQETITATNLHIKQILGNNVPTMKEILQQIQIARSKFSPVEPVAPLVVTPVETALPIVATPAAHEASKSDSSAQENTPSPTPAPSSTQTAAVAVAPTATDADDKSKTVITATKSSHKDTSHKESHDHENDDDEEEEKEDDADAEEDEKKLDTKKDAEKAGTPE